MYKLLIVDDNNIQLKTLIYYINKSKFNISEIKYAYNGLEGYNISKEYRPDIIIADIAMPEMDGIEMTKKIQSEGLSPQFIYMSCYDDFSYMQSALQNNAVSYLLKPLDENKILEALNNAADRIKMKERMNVSAMADDSIKALRETFLYNLIHSAQFDIKPIKTVLYDLKLDCYKKFILVNMIFTSYDNETISIGQIKSKLDSMYIDNDIISAFGKNQDIFFLFMTKNTDNEIFTNNIIKHINAIINFLKKNLNIDARFIVALPTNTLFEISTMLSQIDSVRINSKNHSNEKILLYNQNKLHKDNINVDKFKQAIEELIVSNPTHKEISNFINSLLPSANDYTKEDLSQLYSTINISIQLIFIDANINISDVFGNRDLIGNNINRFNDINRLKLWFGNILSIASDYYKKSGICIPSPLVKKIINYVNCNFRTINSISDISASLYVSTSYARTMFKKYTGKTILDYITTLRIDEAKRLLSKPSIRISDVAESIGYKSVSHFRSIFKEYTGVNVSDFRTKAIEREKNNETKP